MEKKQPEIVNACEEILATCAVNNLRKLTRVTTTRFNESIKSTGMRTTQMCIILAIGSAPGNALTTYAEKLCMDLSTLTRSIESLEKKGFIVLKSGKRRERLAYTTEAAEQKIIEVYPIWQKSQTNFLEDFGNENWETHLNAAANSTK